MRFPKSQLISREWNIFYFFSLDSKSPTRLSKKAALKISTSHKYLK